MHKKLFIPGPVEVSKDVLLKMATPMIGHRGKDASELQKRISEKLKIVFNTKEEILLSTSSGSGLMEGAVRSCTKKRAAIFSIGAFGKKWYEIAKCNGVPADLYEFEWGEALKSEFVDDVLKTGKYDLITITHNETSTGIMNPVEEIAKVVKRYPDIIWCLDTVSSMAGTRIDVDELGVDICVTSSQKALGLPPGIAVCSFSTRAIERAKQVENRGFYFDLLKLHEAIIKRNYQYPSTPSISHMYALDYALDKMLEEGMDNRFKRHIEMANYVRNWAEKYFDVFGDKNHLSNTVTVIKNTRDISIADLNKALGERGLTLANGYGKIKDKTFRIAHMAECSLDDIKDLIENINDILKLK